MSKMLEQAIIDAEALREAALKSAEQSIIEKYSEEVKTAIDQLLEQPEDEISGLDFEDAAGDASEGPTDEFPDVPRADTDGDDMCPCPDEGEEIVIDLMKIAQELEDEMTDREDIVSDVEDELQDADQEEEEDEMALQEDQDLDIPEEWIDQLVEKVNLNVTPVPGGQPGGTTNKTMERELENIIKARLAVDAEAEEATPTEQASDPVDTEKLVQIASTEELELNEQIETLTKDKKDLVKSNNDLKKLMSKMKVKLEEVNLTNAQLYYTNKVLGSTSLNERQKTNIVESLSNTSSVEETKVIFDTLQSAVGSDTKVRPQSLDEAVSRPSTTLPRREEKRVNENTSSRWKALAGIHKD